jgi:hypothetical protein
VKVFLSYHLKDRLAAEGLKKGLEAAGLEVVDPAVEATPGENPFEVVGKALERCQAMVLVISPDAVDSPWFQRAWEYAITQVRFHGRVVPVLARRTERIPWILDKLSILDLKAGAVRTGRKAAERIKLPLVERRRLLGS